MVSVWACSWSKHFLPLIRATLAGPFLHKNSASGCFDTVAGGPAHFECETVEAHVPVCWFKDGVELGLSGSRFSQEDVGTRHRLVADSVSMQDEGTYSCRMGEHSVDFQLRISGEQPNSRLGGCGACPAVSGTCKAELALHCLCK